MSIPKDKLLPSWNPANLTTEDGFLQEVLRLHDIKQETTAPAKVVSYDRSTHTAKVQILVKKAYNTIDGAAYVDWPEFTVPVLFQQQGGMLIDVPIYPGDTGYVVAGHRDGSTAIEKNSGVTEAPTVKTTASSAMNSSSGNKGGGGGGSVSESQAEELTATVDIKKLAESPIGETSGSYCFVYTGSVWTLGGKVSVDLSDYGITVNGTPLEGASITMKYVAPIAGVGGRVQLSVKQGIEGKGYSYSTPSSGSGNKKRELTNGEKISRKLAGTNSDIRHLLGTNTDKKSLAGTKTDVKLASDIRSFVGTSGSIKTLKGTNGISRRIRKVVEEVAKAVKKVAKKSNGDSGAEDNSSSGSESSNSSETQDIEFDTSFPSSADLAASGSQSDEVTENTTNEGPQAPDTFLLHRYENGYFVPTRFGGVEIDTEDELNLVIGNTKKVQDGEDEEGKPKYKQTVFGKLTISRAGKAVVDAPGGHEIRADVDVMGQLVIDGEMCAVGNAVFNSNVGVGGEVAVKGDVSSEGNLEVGGTSHLNEAVTVGKAYKKAIIDPHQDLKEGKAFDTAKFRMMDIMNDVVNEDDERVVFGTSKVIALATEGKKKSKTVYKDKVVIVAGDNIKVSQKKVGHTTYFTITSTGGGGGGGGIVGENDPTFFQNIHSAAKNNQLWVPVRQGDSGNEYKFHQLDNWKSVFWYDHANHTIRNCQIYAGRTAIECDDTVISEDFTGWVYALLNHPVAGKTTVEIFCNPTRTLNTDNKTYYLLYRLWNGYVYADYRATPTVPLYE